MNTNEKNEFDEIFSLQEMTSKRINYRQAAEWKITIALWTVLSIFIGTVITGRISSLNLQSFLIFATIGIAIISVLYILYLYMVWKFQQLQLSLLADFDLQLYKLSNPNLSVSTKAKVDEWKKYKKISWSFFLRIGITLILLVGFVLAVFLAGGNKC